MINKFISARRIFYVILFVSLIIQLIHGDMDNSITSLICFISSWVTIYIILRKNIFIPYLLPSFVILSFMISILAGPLIFQSLSFNLVTFNLTKPIYVVLLSSLYLFSMIISLFIFIYFNLSSVSNTIRSKLNYKLGVLSIPSNTQLWIMGLIGLIILALESTYKYSGGAQYGNVGQKFLEGFKFLAYAPFLIPITNIVYLKKSLLRSTKYLLVLFTFLLLVISLALNSRGEFANGISTMIVLFGFFILSGQIILSKKLKQKLIISFLILIFILPQASDFATAMVIARSDRTKISSTEMISKTIEVFSDKAKLQRYKNAYMKFTKGIDYNEAYLNNPFLDRFINIKFFDNMMSLPSVMNGDYSDRIYDVSIDKMMALLPTPVLELIGYPLDKAKLQFSMGDYMYMLHAYTELGGFKVGSSVAHGFSMFGYFTFLIMIPLYILFYTFIQSLSSSNQNTIFLAPVIMLLIMKFYFISFNDNFFGIVGFVVRSLPQAILLYLIIYYLTKLISRKESYEN